MKMKNKIIEICELGQPQSIIHRENEPITELIKTDSLIEELNKQLILSGVSQQRELLLAYEEFTSLKVLGEKTPRISKQMVDDFLVNNYA